MNNQEQENMTVETAVETPVEVPAEAAEVVAEAPSAPKAKRVGRLRFFITKAATKVRVLYFIALALGLIFAFTLFASGSVIVNAPITEIPVFDMFIPEEELSNMTASFDNLLAEFEGMEAEGTPEEIAEIEAQFGITLEELKAALKAPSINSIATLVKALSVPEMEETAALNDALGQVGQIFDILVLVILGIGIFFGALALLSVAFLKKGLLIFTYIISAGYVFLFVGMPSLIILTVCFIAYVTLTTIINQSYKKYKRSF